MLFSILGPDQFSMSDEREHELNLLKSSEFSEMLSKLDIQMAHNDIAFKYL